MPTGKSNSKTTSAAAELPPVVNRIYFDQLREIPKDASEREQLIYHYVEILALFGATGVQIKYLESQDHVSGMTGTSEYYGPGDNSIQKAVFMFIKHIIKEHNKLMFNVMQGFIV